MWVIVHLLTALALGCLLPVPLWALLVSAALLHIVLDLVPHWDYTRLRRRGVWAASDVAMSLAVAAVCYWVLGLPARILLVGAVSAVPDLDVLDVYLPMKRGVRWFPSHWRRFPHGSCGPAVGVSIQATLTILAALVVALSVAGRL